MAGLSLYTLTLLAHVTAAIALVGSTLVSPYLRRALVDARSVAEVRGLIGYLQRSSRWKPLAALALLGTGVYLGSAGWWSQSWFFVAVAGWIVNAVLGAAVIGRSADALGAAVARAPEGPVGAEIDALRRSTPWSLATGAMIATDFTMLYLMFNKPELVGSLALLAGSNILALVVTLVRTRAAATAPLQALTSDL